MRTLEFVEAASSYFDKYAVAMGGFVDPDFLDLGDLEPSAQALELKEIAVASLSHIVKMRSDGLDDRVILYRSVARNYYASEEAGRLPHRVRSYHPNALVHPTLVEKLAKSRYGRIQIVNLLDGMPVSPMYRDIIIQDKNIAAENVARENGNTNQ